jgi:hypothetical protein
VAWDFEKSGDHKSAINKWREIFGTSFPDAIAACHNCNDRRGKRPWEKWLEANFPDTSIMSIMKINEYRKLYPYAAPEGADSRLTESELLEYNSIVNDWDGIWSRAVKLRNQINKRKKSKL